MKSFTFSALIQTPIGARGFIRLSGLYDNGVYVLRIGDNYFRDANLSSLMQDINDKLQLEFLEVNVSDFCISDLHECDVKNDRKKSTRVYAKL